MGNTADDPPYTHWVNGHEVNMTTIDGKELHGVISLGAQVRAPHNEVVGEAYAHEFGYGVRLVHHRDYNKPGSVIYGSVENRDPGTFGAWGKHQATIVANGIALVQALTKLRGEQASMAFD